MIGRVLAAENNVRYLLVWLYTGAVKQRSWWNLCICQGCVAHFFTPAALCVATVWQTTAESEGAHLRGGTRKEWRKAAGWKSV